MNVARSTAAAFVLVLLAFAACSGIGEAGEANETGAVLASQGLWSQALDEYGRAIQLKPDFAEAYNNRGAAHRALGDLEAAVADFTEATRLKDDLAVAHVNVASVLLDLGADRGGGPAPGARILAAAVRGRGRGGVLQFRPRARRPGRSGGGDRGPERGHRPRLRERGRVLHSRPDIRRSRDGPQRAQGRPRVPAGTGLPAGRQRLWERGARQSRLRGRLRGPRQPSRDQGRHVACYSRLRRGDLAGARTIRSTTSGAAWRTSVSAARARPSRTSSTRYGSIPPGRPRTEPGDRPTWSSASRSWPFPASTRRSVSTRRTRAPTTAGPRRGPLSGKPKRPWPISTAAIRLFADDPEAYKGRGKAHVELGELESAVDDFGSAIRLAPRDPEPLRLRAAVYIELGRLEDATADLDGAIRMDSGDATSINARGLAYLELGEPEKAVKDFAAAIAAERTDNARYYINQGRAYLELDEPEKAVESFDNAVVRDSRYRYLFRAALSSYEQINRRRRALPDLETALELVPVLVLGYRSRASVLTDLGRLDEAESDLRRIAEIESDVVWIEALIETIQNAPPEPVRPPPAPRRPASAGQSPAEIAAAQEAIKSAIKASAATLHVGKQRTVCGTVTAVRHGDEARVVFIDFGPPDPDQDLVVYFPSLVTRVGDWPDFVDRSIDIIDWLMNRELCVTGRIERFRGRPAINASFWHQYNVPQ